MVHADREVLPDGYVTCDPVIHLLMANRLNDFVYCPDSVSINVMSM